MTRIYFPRLYNSFQKRSRCKQLWTKPSFIKYSVKCVSPILDIKTHVLRVYVQILVLPISIAVAGNFLKKTQQKIERESTS